MTESATGTRHPHPNKPPRVGREPSHEHDQFSDYSLDPNLGTVNCALEASTIGQLLAPFAYVGRQSHNEALI